MAHKTEVERKFLVLWEALPPLPPGSILAQGYLGVEPTVRVRTEARPDGGREAFLSIKGSGLVGREEFEYSIPFEEAEALLALSRGSVIRKTRHRLPVVGAPGLTWEIDVFEGDNQGLVVAEVELPDPDHPFPRPEWLGEDVTEDARYKNARLSTAPFRSW